MTFPQLVGASYKSWSRIADLQQCINLFIEKIESGVGKNQYYLLGTPGLKFRTVLNGNGVVALFTTMGRTFAVTSIGDLLEHKADKTTVGYINIGSGGPYSMASNGKQLMVVNATTTNGFILDITTYIATQITAAGWEGATTCCYVDGYFLALVPNTNRVHYSGQYDGLTWDGLDFVVAEGKPDPLVSINTNHREIWMFGSDRIEIFYDSGDPLDVFTRISGAFIESGCAAGRTVCQVDNSLLWLGADSRGDRIAYRADGYSPVRISNHAVEQEWAKYSIVSDAFSFAELTNGHPFWWLIFPTADKTWCYDISTGMWHERAYWDTSGAIAKYTRHLAACHTFNFGVHMIGDRRNGNLYELDMATYSDNGDVIRRQRVAPHISNSGLTTFYQQLQIDMETGVGTMNGSDDDDPQIMLELSRNGGASYGAILQSSIGEYGHYLKRVIWRRLGRARDMVFRLTITSRVKVAIVGAFLDMTTGSN